MPSPDHLRAAVPLDGALQARLQRQRAAIAATLRRDDPRLLVVVGPCSIHDPAAAIEYAGRLATLQSSMDDALRLVMRTYFEKPRSTVGWKGLLNDPHLDRSFSLGDGLVLCRRLLRQIAALGVPTACEFLDVVSPAYFADAVCWGAIGARTSESQVHRELASGLAMPVGFKNGTAGSIDVAIQGVVAAAQPHAYLGIDAAGRAAIIKTPGNPTCHIILRGGKRGPNYQPAAVQEALQALRDAALPARLMIDVSHGNSGKCLQRQREVVDDVAAQLAAGEAGIVGVMMESFLEPGAQAFGPPATLRYGQSITDPCLGWEDTAACLEQLAVAVRHRMGRQRATQDATKASCSPATL